MSLAGMIEAVGDLLATVPGVGTKIHKYERWGADEAAFKNLFLEGDRILGWTITRETTTSVDHVGGTSRDTHTLIIRGYMGLQDAANTEKIFQNLLEAIRATFQPNRRLTVGGVGYAHTSERIQVRTVDHRMFGGYLVHFAELLLRAEELVTS
jgi:hypothetical protein